MECLRCRADIPAASRFCIECGASLLPTCPSCGKVNPSRSTFCASCGGRLARGASALATSQSSAGAAPTASSAERRQLTVMFCDLVGSTALSTRLDPEDLREVIGSFHRCVAGIVGRFDGFLAKYMGDGVLVYFGYPQAHEDNAERAVQAGLALVEALDRSQGPVRLQVRIGIGTGLVVVGAAIGTGDAEKHGVVGETPNLAARLQELAEPNAIVIGPGTRRLLGELFEYRDLGTVEVKGFAEPLHAYRVLRPGTIESRFEALHGAMLTPLVGRDDEIELLLRRWERAKRGDGQVVLLSGEPGVGKSRIAAALHERIAHEPHTRLRCFCSPHHQNSALHPSIAQLGRAAGFDRDDTPEARLDKLETLLAPASPPVQQVALLAELLSIPRAAERYPLDMPPKRKKRKTLEALMSQLEALASQRPLLAIYEDIHWIDPTSRELLDLTVARAPRLPILLVITFRPEMPPPWAGQPHVTTMALNRLGQRDGAALVECVSGNRVLPAEIVDEIVERSDGMPLFLEELTKAVLDTAPGKAGTRAAASAAPRPAMAVPATLRGSLVARLDRLGTTVKDVAQVGAVIGREFSYELLAAIVPRAAPELDAALDRLSAAGLVFCRGTPPEATYLFKHALVQDAAYRTLLRGQRQALHAKIAKALEEQFRERSDIEPELVAHHLTEGAQAQRAVSYWLKAGHRSAGRSADREAVRQLRRGLAVLMTLPESFERDRLEFEFQFALGTPLISVYSYSGPEVGAAYERAIALCESLGDIEQLVPACFGLAIHRLVSGDTRTAERLALRCCSLAQERGDPAQRLLSHRAMGVVFMERGALHEARSEFDKLVTLYDARRDQSLAARCINDPRATGLALLSVVLWVMGYPEQGQRTAREAFRCAGELEHINTAAHVRHYAGAQLAELLRDVAAVRDRAEAVLALAAKYRMPTWRGHGNVLLGWARAQDGCAEEGLGLVERGIVELDALGTAFHRPHYLGLLAELHARRGDVDSALCAIGQAYEQVRRSEEQFWEADLHRIEGELRWLSGASAAQVEDCFATALAVARRQGAKSWELRAAASLARLWRRDGECRKARDLLAPIYGWFTEGLETADLKDASALLKELA